MGSSPSTTCSNSSPHRQRHQRQPASLRRWCKSILPALRDSEIEKGGRGAIARLSSSAISGRVEYRAQSPATQPPSVAPPTAAAWPPPTAAAVRPPSAAATPSAITKLLLIWVSSVMMPLKALVPSAANSVNAKCILLEKSNIRVSKKGVVVNGRHEIQEIKECLTLVADETASVYFLLWNTECEAFEPGDIICLSSGIFSYHRNKLVLRSGRKGKAEKVGEFTMVFVEKLNMSEIQWQASEGGPPKLVLGPITSTDLWKSPPLL